MMSAGIRLQTVGKFMIQAVMPSALLIAATVSSTYAQSNEALQDLIRATQQLSTDSRALVAEVQRVAVGYNNPAVNDSNQVMLAANNLLTTLQYYNQANANLPYNQLLSAHLRLQSSINPLLRFTSVSVAMEMVESSVQEVRYYKECTMDAGQGGQSQALMMIGALKNNVMQTENLARYEGPYGSFWRETAVRDLLTAVQAITELERELQYTGTSMTAREVQMLLSKSKRSLYRGGFSNRVLSAHIQSQQQMDQIQMVLGTSGMLPPANGGGYGGGYGGNGGGYGGGGYNQGGGVPGVPPIACNQYRRGRPGQ